MTNNRGRLLTEFYSKNLFAFLKYVIFGIFKMPKICILVLCHPSLANCTKSRDPVIMAQCASHALPGLFGPLRFPSTSSGRELCGYLARVFMVWMSNSCHTTNSSFQRSPYPLAEFWREERKGKKGYRERRGEGRGRMGPNQDWGKTVQHGTNDHS